MLQQRCDLRAHFDTIYASCEIGCVKPTKDFYGHILAHNPWNLSAADILVVDDRESHVRAPSDLGFQTYQFKTPGECSIYLSTLYNNENTYNS
jgi:HAD superfamily hydrolase (TIGR01509 family)